MKDGNNYYFYQQTYEVTNSAKLALPKTGMIAKRFKKSGCIALQTEEGEEMAQFADALQEKLGYDTQIITISKPTAYGEYEPYHLVDSYDEFSKQASRL